MGLDDKILRMAREAGITDGLELPHEVEAVERFGALVIEDFLTRSGQYLTNDASRDAAIAEAVAAEREACAGAVRFADTGTEAAAIIRARP